VKTVKAGWVTAGTVRSFAGPASPLHKLRYERTRCGPLEGKTEEQSRILIRRELPRLLVFVSGCEARSVKLGEEC
jgi:hypothetical protein